MKYTCAACGVLTTPVRNPDRLDSGMVLICQECRCETVVDLDTPEVREARQVAAKSAALTKAAAKARQKAESEAWSNLRSAQAKLAALGIDEGTGGQLREDSGDSW